MLTRGLKAAGAVAGILSMLLAPAASACTGLMLKTADGAFVHGRTAEFGVDLDLSVAAIPRGVAFTGHTPQGDGLKYRSKYGVVGSVAFGAPEVLDGLNEAGLAVGAFYFPTFAGYADLTPENKAKALAPAEFANWLVTQFATVAEARAAIEAGSAVIVNTIDPKWGPQPAPFHFIIYDRTGAALVIEPVDGQFKLYDNPLGVITNSPSFDWHRTNLRNYVSLRPLNVPPVELGRAQLQPLGQGSGMVGLPGDFTPPSRFVRAAAFSATAVPPADATAGVLQVFHLLNNFDIPKGIARDKEGDQVGYDITLATVARDPQALRYYWKTYDDQTIRVVDMKALGLVGAPAAGGGEPKVRFLALGKTQPIADMSSQLAGK